MPITVTPAATPSSGSAPFSTVLTATASGGTAPYTFVWTDTTTNVYIGSGATCNYNLFFSSTRTIRCDATDDTGATGSNTVAVTAGGAAATVTTVPSPATGFLDAAGNFAVQFNTSPSAGTSPYQITVFAQNEVLGTGATVDAVFTEPGDFTATVQVIDAVGATTSVAVPVTVRKTVQSPVAGFPFRTGGRTITAANGQTINYWPLYDSWSERRNTHTGGTSRMKVGVDWSQKGWFRQYALGFTQRDTSGAAPKLKRFLPLQSDDDPTQWLMDLESGRYGTPTGNKQWVENTWVEYQASFGTPDFFLLSDDDLAAGYGGNELGRYVTRQVGISARERKLSGANDAVIFYDATSPVPTPRQLGVLPFAILPEATLTYKWWHVPCSAYPRQTVQNMLGKVNATTFDTIGAVSPTGVGGPYPRGTCLFVGVEKESLKPYVGPDDQYYVSPVYTFRYQPIGWNFAPDPKVDAGSGVQYGWNPQYTGGVKRLIYSEADFDALFRSQ